MDLKLPEETLMKLGFRLLDIIYGELIIKKGKYYDEAFVDKNGVARLGYDKPGSEKVSYLGSLYYDREFFLSIIPVEIVDYQRVLKAWFEERYKRRVDATRSAEKRLRSLFEERYKRKVNTKHDTDHDNLSR